MCSAGSHAITVLDLGTAPDAAWCLGLLREAEIGCWFDRRARRGISLLLLDPDRVIRSPDGLWPALAAAAGTASPGPFGFAGGWAGCIPYEAALTALDIHRAASGTAMAHYPGALAIDHAQGRAFAVGRGAAGHAAAHAWVARFHAHRGCTASSSSPSALRVADPGPDRTAFAQQVCAVQEWIAAGQVYVANLTYRIYLDGLADPAAAYDRLSARHPAPYAAVLRDGDHWILSSSPELLVRRRGAHTWTRPIKGTRRAGEARALSADAKERAELTMVVDMERNDLGRVARVGTVHVSELFGVEAHPGLAHLVATVEGEVPGAAGELLRAMLPGGSVTGAPKRRAVELLGPLEGDPRGVYTGTLGYCDDGGDMQWNVAIRTLEVSHGQCRYGTGGGITIDSHPLREYAETRLKAAGPLQALGVPWE